MQNKEPKRGDPSGYAFGVKCSATPKRRATQFCAKRTSATSDSCLELVLAHRTTFQRDVRNYEFIIRIIPIYLLILKNAAIRSGAFFSA